MLGYLVLGFLGIVCIGLSILAIAIIYRLTRKVLDK